MKAKIIGISIAAAVAAALIVAIVYVDPVDVAKSKEDDNPFKDWNRSGPFAVNKFEYKIGENVFIAVEGLGPDEVGEIVFVLPNGTTKYITIPFDSNAKTGFNQYFKPSLSKARGICSTDDLIGNWTVVFRGTNHKPITFEFLNETLATEKSIFERVC